MSSNLRVEGRRCCAAVVVAQVEVMEEDAADCACAARSPATPPKCCTLSPNARCRCGTVLPRSGRGAAADGRRLPQPALIDVEACDAPTAMAVACDVDTMAAIVAALGGLEMMHRKRVWPAGAVEVQSVLPSPRWGGRLSPPTPPASSSVASLLDQRTTRRRS